MKKTIQLFAVIVIAVTLPISAFAQGIMLRGVGPANEALAGTATAMPLDASGTLLWNPAGISALKKNEMSIGLELIQPHSRVTTTNGGTTLASNKGEAGITPVPSMAFVWRKCPKSPFTYGVSLAGVGGAASLYTPDSNSASAVYTTGRSATVLVLQVTPTASVQLTDRLSIGVAPIIDLASLNINPMALGGPALSPLHTYGTKYAWGGGFQIGTLYDFKNHFKAGFMFKSPIWAENIYFTGANVSVNSESRSFDLDLPMTLSTGISYDGFKDTVIGMDVRYFDYAHTAGFEKGLSAGNVDGLGWESVWSINVGLEHKFNRKLKGRMGYCWNENPIPGRSAVLNVAAPLMQQHCVSFGVGYTFAKDLEMSLAYVHAFKADTTGPNGPNSPELVTNEASADTVSAGISKRW